MIRGFVSNKLIAQSQIDYFVNQSIIGKPAENPNDPYQYLKIQLKLPIFDECKHSNTLNMDQDYEQFLYKYEMPDISSEIKESCADEKNEFKEMIKWHIDLINIQIPEEDPEKDQNSKLNMKQGFSLVHSEPNKSHMNNKPENHIEKVDDKQQKIQELIDRTIQVDQFEAEFFLQSSNWKVEDALSLLPPEQVQKIAPVNNQINNPLEDQGKNGYGHGYGSGLALDQDVSQYYPNKHQPPQIPSVDEKDSIIQSMLEQTTNLTYADAKALLEICLWDIDESLKLVAPEKIQKPPVPAPPIQPVAPQNNREELIKEFMKSTKCDKTNAEFFIDMSGGSLETALQNFENFK